jgi:hypothetical protein
MRRKKQESSQPPPPNKDFSIVEMREVPGQFAANMLWLQTNSAHYYDRWVALYNGRLLTSAASKEDLRPGIINHPYLSNVMILKVGQDYKNDSRN